jgi:predicted TPR repeat methyltransferase
VEQTEHLVSVAEAVDRAVQLQRAGHLDLAEALYRRTLEADPGNPDALHFLGVLSHQRGRSADAVALIRQALERAPEYPDALSNLGNVLRSQGELAEAEACYRRAIAIRPDHAPALLMLGAVLDAQGRSGEAADNYLRAVDGGSCEPDLLRLVAATLRAEGRLDEAATLYRRWLTVRPNDPYALHLLAACTRQEVPERAPDSYVERLFDRFAETFDEKLAQLDYRAPALVAEAVACVAGPPKADLCVLDAGCGTGLCGQYLRPCARELVGVDLSAEMLARARGRGLYDRLVQHELTAHLQGWAESLDLVVSADTLVYFGSLDAVLAAAAGALRPGGHLVFTLERTDPDAAPAGYRLNPSGRYSHSPPYVDAALRRAGLVPLFADEVVLRKEGGDDVPGLLVAAQRPALAA